MTGEIVGKLARTAAPCAAAALWWGVASPAGAASAPEIEEIQVTARKRTENLSVVPQSITVYRGDALDDLQVATSPELARATPNLMWHSVLGFTTPSIFLRGIGNATLNANQAGPVGILRDGIYQGATVTYGFGLFDLERVEILKGPQGTLFGRNTTAGVVNFISRRPDPAAGTTVDGRLTYGRFNEADAEAAAGFALGDHAAVRLAGLTLTRDGYVDNRAPGSGIAHEGKIHLWSTRGQLRLLAGDTVDILLNVHGGENASDVVPGKQVGVVCPAGVKVPTLGACTDFFGFRDTTNLRENFNNVRSFDNVSTWGADATLTWNAPGFALVSQTGFDANRRRLTTDSDTGPVAALKTNVVSRFHQVSEELHAVSTTAGPLDWIAGAAYYRDDLKAFQDFTANAFGPGGLSHFFPVEEGIASYLDQGVETYAAFGEGTYHLTAPLALTVGGRWTRDRRIADTHAFIFNATGYALAFLDQATANSRLLVPTIPNMHLMRSWSNLSGRAVLSYQVADQVLAYASVSRGFKGGDFNGGALFGPAEANIADPEYVTSYEAGVKASTPDRRLSLDAAAFYYDFSNQQVSVLVPGSNATLQQLSNAAKTEVKGVEADMTVRPVDDLTLEGKAGLLDAHFKRFQLDPANPATNYAGNRTASSPKFSFAGIGQYRVPLTDLYALSFEGDADYKIGHFFTADNNPALYQRGYWLFNASASLVRAGGIRLSGWVKNLADRSYYASGLANTGLGFIEVVPGPPRTFGLTLELRY